VRDGKEIVSRVGQKVVKVWSKGGVDNGCGVPNRRQECPPFPRSKKEGSSVGRGAVSARAESRVKQRSAKNGLLGKVSGSPSQWKKDRVSKRIFQGGRHTIGKSADLPFTSIRMPAGLSANWKERGYFRAGKVTPYFSSRGERFLKKADFRPPQKKIGELRRGLSASILLLSIREGTVFLRKGTTSDSLGLNPRPTPPGESSGQRGDI